VNKKLLNRNYIQKSEESAVEGGQVNRLPVEHDNECDLLSLLSCLVLRVYILVVSKSKTRF